MNIVVGQTGAVSGLVGIDLSGSGNEIANFGTITGSVGINVRRSAAPGQSRITNAGTIIGQAGNVIELSGNHDVVNTGSIYGDDSGISFTANVGTSHLYNKGIIVGLGILGAVTGGAASEQIINEGLIDGGIDFGGNADLSDGRFGAVIGTIDAGSGNDTVFGGNGDEVFEPGDGDDIVDGGSGNDTVVIFRAGNATIDLRLTDAQDTGQGMDTFIGIEHVRSDYGNDLLIGNALNNRLSGGLGADTLEGGLGNDTVEGGSAADSDTASYSGSAVAVVSLALQGQAQNTRGYGFDTLINIDNLSGGSGNDVFTGDNNANMLLGNGGNDTLRGGLEADVLDGGAGIDTVVFDGEVAITVDLRRGLARGEGDNILSSIENLTGSSGADGFIGTALANIFIGNGGNDTLNGGAGNDQLYGGTDTGFDVFVFNTALNSATN
ncbi:calcium-binding protein [Microvirga vignae]|nr:calcium-binding protein [Microvirga vignae]